MKIILRQRVKLISCSSRDCYRRQGAPAHPSMELARVHLPKYLCDEWKDKLHSDKSIYDLNLNEWKNESNKQYPQQKNGVDCGVFAKKCADWTSDGLVPDYSQQHMPQFRQVMMIEIIQGKTLD